MAEHDLTNTVSAYFDRHLIFPLLEFLQVKGIYPEEEMLNAKIALLSNTNMVDYELDLRKTLHQVAGTELPKDMESSLEERRERILQHLAELQAAVEPILLFFNDLPLIKELRQEKLFTLSYLEENYGDQVNQHTLEALYRYAKFQYDCGNYSGAADFLYSYRALATNEKQSFSALWGKFASEILVTNWDNALEDMKSLKEVIDAKDFTSPAVQLQQRTWLLHWSLFVFFNHPNGKNGIIDLFFQDKYMNTIQTTCPHLLRYLTTAVITNKRRRHYLKDLVKILQQEHNTYRDPITEFVECLYINYDFEGAQQKLRECDTVLVHDFFLVACRDEFIESARVCIFEIYCRIHQCIDIAMLAEKLNMEQEDAERWIVDLIRNARLDAKIDSAANHVIMGTQYSGLYQQIIDKTKGLASKTHDMASELEKRYNEYNT